MSKWASAGGRWRIHTVKGDGTTQLAVEDDGIFDELVVGKWLHVEHMDGAHWWMRLGDARIEIPVRGPDDVELEIERGAYAPVPGSSPGD